MEKSNLFIILLSIILVVLIGFVINDLYFKDSISKDTNNLPNKPSVNKISTSSANATYESCISNTKDSPQCKDCCDCLTGVDSATRTSCRDACAVHDFSTNSNYLTVSVPSSLGRDGDYSICVAKGATDCKTCCENQMGLQCGDYQYCRTACNNAFGDPKHNITVGGA